MKSEGSNAEQAFYDRCADVLGLERSYRRFPYSKRTRWNNRTPGNGRFPGFGLVRLFGGAVHVQFRAPQPANRWFASEDEAIAFLATLAQPPEGPLRRAA